MVVRNVFPLRRYVIGRSGPGPAPGQVHGGLPPPAILPPIQSIAYVTGQAGCFGAPTSLTSRTMESTATTTNTRFDMTMMSSAFNDDDEEISDPNRPPAALVPSSSTSSSGSSGHFCCDEALVEALVVTQGNRVWHTTYAKPCPHYCFFLRLIICHIVLSLIIHHCHRHLLVSPPLRLLSS